MMNNFESDQQLQNGIELIKHAYESVRQQKLNDTQLWQKKAQELEVQNQNIQARAQHAEEQLEQTRQQLSDVLNENGQLRAQIESLKRSLQDKISELSKFHIFNQSLKTLMDQTPAHSPLPTSLDIPSSYDSYANMTKQSVYAPRSYDSSAVAAEQPPYYDVKKPIFSQRMGSPRSPTPANSSPSQQQARQTRSSAKSFIFIKAAKDELGYGDFNQMISEINMYNKKTQTREETIANVKKLLCPAHKNLYDQFYQMISGL